MSGLAREMDPRIKLNNYWTIGMSRKSLLGRNSLGILRPNFQLLYMRIYHQYLTIFDQIQSLFPLFMGKTFYIVRYPILIMELISLWNLGPLHTQDWELVSFTLQVERERRSVDPSGISVIEMPVRPTLTSSTLIGGKGGANPSSLHTTLEGPTYYVNASWM